MSQPVTISPGSLEAIIDRLSRRGGDAAEANCQADIRQLLLCAPLSLEPGDIAQLEVQVGEGQRMDVEVGATVFEVKRDLRKGRTREDARSQLSGYVARRERDTGVRYVGVLTDGAEWICHHLVDDELVQVSTLLLERKATDLQRLIRWLDGVLATVRNAKPTPSAIESGLGAGSSAHALDRARLAALYARGRNLPSVKMKRLLWGKLLTSALGTQFKDEDELFIEHSLLVNSAEIIAHAVLGLPIESISPASLLTGAKFDEVGVYGVVEMDFFDWVLEVPGGEIFVQTLARRLCRFDWSVVDHDVLKVLYESIIGADTRKKLGEYYTPDWLAEHVVAEAITNPLNDRVLDPACGSGTFLFHAVRRFLEHAQLSGMSPHDQLNKVSEHVIGVDLHPVAVSLARVTYLLAIGRDRLAGDRPEIHVPVYLGDSMQWQQSRFELLSRGLLCISTTDGLELFSSELKFPEHLLADARMFDELVQQMVAKATGRAPGTAHLSIGGVLDRLSIKREDRGTLESTYKTLCRLHDESRNHIWGYYVRNLARPVWLARPENRVDVIVGNPPWLAYRHMPREMQASFRSMSESRGLWHGSKLATHQDLSALFVARSIQLYLKPEGRFGFVMPNAVIDRLQYEGFRSGLFNDWHEPSSVTYSQPWDLRRLRPHFFPRACAVITGQRSSMPGHMPTTVETWSGRVDKEHAAWAEVCPSIVRSVARAEPQASTDQTRSEYASHFTQGATIVPRVLFMASRQESGVLGVPAGRVRVRSTRSSNEKQPWKDLPALEGVVETEFLRPILVGESIVPFRVVSQPLAIIPWDGKSMLVADSDRIESYPGLTDWFRRAAEIWNAHRKSVNLSLNARLDFHHGLTKQFPITTQRVVYTKSGMHLTAARIVDRRSIVDHKLYWANVSNDDEALYLCAILNAAETTSLARPFMSYGKDERDIDKHIWKLPIPRFDVDNKLHRELATLGAQAEKAVQALELAPSNFIVQRRRVRETLAKSQISDALDAAVRRLLGASL